MFLNSNLTNHDNSRFATGLGTRQGTMVHSMAMSIETMWLKRRPVVDMYPLYLSSMTSCLMTPVRKLYEYIIPRLSILLSYKHRKDFERGNALLTAEYKARQFCPRYYEALPTGFENFTYKNRQDFLLGTNDIHCRGSPRYEHDVVVFELIKYNAIGKANCLLSFRKFDDSGECYGNSTPKDNDNSRRHTLDPRLRTHRGALGRLFASNRAKVPSLSSQHYILSYYVILCFVKLTYSQYFSDI